MKLFVLVVTLVIAILGTQAIIVLDNTIQQQNATRRRPSLPMRDSPPQQQAVAESSRDEVKVKGFRSSVVHKPASPDGQPGGLTVQDPPKGWPFSEIHVNFNSHLPEEQIKSSPGIITQRPELSGIKQRQQLQVHQKQLQMQPNQLQRQQRMNKQNYDQHLNQGQLLHHQEQNLIYPQQHLTQQQTLNQQLHQVVAPIVIGKAHENVGFTEAINSHKVKTSAPYIITANGHEQSGFVPGNSDQKPVNEHTENIPQTRRPNSGINVGYNFGFVTPPDAFKHSNQMLNVIKHELSGTRLLGEEENELYTPHSSGVSLFKSNRNQLTQAEDPQQIINQHSSHVIHVQPASGNNQNQHQATSNVNIQHNEVVNGDPNYVWRDVSPSVEISSNTPNLTGGSKQNLLAAEQKSHAFIEKTNDVTKGGQGSATSEHSTNSDVEGRSHVTHFVTGTHLQGHQVGQVQTFDHANALGNSANFGYGDAIVALPVEPDIETSHANQGHSLAVSQSYAMGIQENKVQHPNNGHQVQNSPDNPGKNSEKTGNAVFGVKKTIAGGNAGHAVYNLGVQQNQHQQQTSSLLPQANYGVGATSQKVLLKLNKGLTQGFSIPGSLVLGNGLHVGYASTNAGQQNILLSTQGMVNTAGHGGPLQAFYIPLAGLQPGQLENHQAEAGFEQQVAHVQQHIPGLVGSHGALPVNHGVINTAPLPYVGLHLINGGIGGYTGTRGFPILQGNILGGQGLHGVEGGTELQTGQQAGVLHGGNQVSLRVAGLATGSQTNRPHQGYNQELQPSQKTIGQQQQHNVAHGPETQHVPLAAGKNVFSFHNTIPYLHQQVNNLQALKPQINMHGNGFGLKIQQRHPITQQHFKLPGHQSFPLGGNVFPHQPSLFPAHDHAHDIQNNVARGYQTSFPTQPQLHQRIPATSNQHPKFILTHLSNTPLNQPPINTKQKLSHFQGTVKSDDNSIQPTALPKLGTPLRDKNALGWLNNVHVGSKPGKYAGPSSNSIVSTNSPYLMGLRPPTANPSFTKK